MTSTSYGGSVCASWNLTICRISRDRHALCSCTWPTLQWPQTVTPTATSLSLVRTLRVTVACSSNNSLYARRECDVQLKGLWLLRSMCDVERSDCWEQFLMVILHTAYLSGLTDNFIWFLAITWFCLIVIYIINKNSKFRLQSTFLGLVILPGSPAK